MKLKKLILVIGLTFLITTSLPPLTQTEYSKLLLGAQAIAQTPDAQRQAEIRSAATEFLEALNRNNLINFQANTLINQGKYQQGFEIYRLWLWSLGMAQTGGLGDRTRDPGGVGGLFNPVDEVEIASTLVKLATLSEKLGLLGQSDQVLSSAADVLRQATDRLAIFENRVNSLGITFHSRFA